MPSITPALADHAARSYGVVTDSELRPLGIGLTRRRSLVELPAIVLQHVRIDTFHFA